MQELNNSNEKERERMRKTIERKVWPIEKTPIGPMIYNNVKYGGKALGFIINNSNSYHIVKL